MSLVKKTFPYGAHEVTIETGELARQATGSVLVTMGETVLLVAVVGKEEASTADFFPLTVTYIEKTYAAGKIPGGFFKREGRLSEREVLTCRLIDRPIRPLFPEGFRNEVQLTVTLLSLDPEVDSDIPALFGCSAALAISGIPFNGPVSAARVGYKDGEYLLNPNHSTVEECDLNLVVAGTKDAVLMVESEANQLSEDVMLGAVMYGHEQMQVAINAINELKAEVGKPTWNWTAPQLDADLVQQVTTFAETDIRTAYAIREKMERKLKIKEIYDAAKAKFVSEDSDESVWKTVEKVLAKLEKTIVRSDIIAGKERIDGRDTKTVRKITCSLGRLPSVHGSAIFTRGETQAIVAATLGTERDAQIIDALVGESKDPFMLHYNFPPYCVGETGFVGAPKRREIGHGMLAKRAMRAVIPSLEDFPYVLRVVSEITESNGSSSMASVCGTSLALMDAGVPTKAPVAGIAMGLIKEDDQFAVLTDILGDEDHLGDMDFKVAGTSDGITALQMDIKIEGITEEIMKVALAQAKDARMHILGIMNESLSAPRTEVSAKAPRIESFNIKPEKIREVIGKGGAMIREITESTNTTIDLDDSGLVKIASTSAEEGARARKWVEDICAELEIGKVYEGPIVKMLDFGAIVELLPGKTGMVHISQIVEERVENINDFLQEGQVVKVLVKEIDRQGKVRLSMKDVREGAPS